MSRLLVILALICAVPIGGVATADVMRVGTLRVVVTDDAGASLEGVEVLVSSQDSLSHRSATTNAEGLAQFAGLDPSARWSVEFQRKGAAPIPAADTEVRAGRTVTLFASLGSGGATVHTSPFDLGTATSGQDLDLRLLETLPSGRSHLANLPLIPGVLPDSFAQPGDPASRSGLNYREIGGQIGVSRDNAYFLEGVDVTDPVAGTYVADLHSETIQEQSVFTGGIQARFAGGTGLVSNVITRAGGNRLQGTLSYFHSDDGLVSRDEHRAEGEFTIDDIGVTVGGPIVQDRAWFFVAYRGLSRDDDVTSLDTQALLRTVENDTDQFVAKLSWQVTPDDRLTVAILGDPTDVSGSLNRDQLNARDVAAERGGEGASLRYARVLRRGVLEAAATAHHAQDDAVAAVGTPRNDILFRTNQAFTLSDIQQGGEGNHDVDERDVDAFRVGSEWLFDTSWGQHTLAGGVEFEEHVNRRDRNFVGGAQYQSLSATIPGTLDAEFVALNPLSGSPEFDVFNTSDFNGLISTVNAADDRPALYALLDANADGTITMAEAGQRIVFDSTAGNPDGELNYFRNLQITHAPQETSSEGVTLWVQDTWQRGKWAVSLGLRSEEWKHVATDGRELFTFDAEVAPRLSVAYDFRGDGRSKVSAFYGRYYDPVRNNLTNHAGTLTGRTTAEQVYLSGGGIDRFVTFRTRGGSTTQQQVFFAPTTETPYTDELTLGYQQDLGHRMSIEASVIKRETRDLIEDYNLGLYAEDTTGGSDYPGDPAHPDSLFLGLEYFGFRDASGALVNPGGFAAIANLAGGRREYEGFELVFRKRFSDRWQALASFSAADADGNSESDSTADFAGDLLFLDPRAPNRYGPQPGSIEQLFRAAGSYSWDFGLTVGATVSWNSGTIASRTFQGSGRNMPIRVAPAEAFEFAGITDRWVAPGSVGVLTNPSWSSTDLRLRYNRAWSRLSAEFYVDVFNVLDDQAVTRELDLVAGSFTTPFGDPIEWVPPRRIFLGVRLGFE